jgi:primosomal protein N' (replication factor Y)
VITAIVVEINVKSQFNKLKPIIEVLDEKPLLDTIMMDLLNWASCYYFYPLGEVLFHALPAALRKGKQTPTLEIWQASETAMQLPELILCRAPKQKAMLDRLKQDETDSQKLQSEFGENWRNTLRELKKKDLVTKLEMDADYIPHKPNTTHPGKLHLNLTSEQQACVTEITKFFQEKKPKPILLHGITGSGKTEVYLRSIETILRQGKQVLVLVPEIGLTPQLLFRFRQHFPQSTIASLHSALADGDRMRIWLGARSGAIQIVIGTRSAVFTPMKNLGAILIDEEHDASFKQQEGFLYQGRDMAIKRAHDTGVPVLLGSATPSLESLHNVNRHRYYYLKLNSRPGDSQRPEMVLQDIRTLPLEAGISSLLMLEIRQHLNNKHQVMLFLNRRGFAPVLLCPSCGWHASCHKCERGMTYHAAAGKAICHHCGLEETINPTCPACHSDQLTTQGQGTERIESVLNTHFPDTPVIRIDRDSTSRKGSLEEKLEIVQQGKPVILIGTQMLTKGHDFPNLTLVGILDVDQALFSMDYRAQERLAQQVLQVAGRAGRGFNKGRVILQTSQPQHPLLLSLLAQGYSKTAEQILNERELWCYPPVGSQALIRVSSANPAVAMNFITKLNVQLRSGTNQDRVDLLGPMPSPLARRADRYRFQLLISAKQRGELHKLLGKALSLLTQARKTGGLRWVIDVDPVDYL